MYLHCFRMYVHVYMYIVPTLCLHVNSVFACGYSAYAFLLQVGFGKGTNSKQLWIDGVDSSLSRQQLERHMNKYGKVCIRQY